MTHFCQSAWAWLQARFRAEGGATAIEYGLIAALVSVVIIVALTAVGSNLTNVFNAIANALGGATSSS